MGRGTNTTQASVGQLLHGPRLVRSAHQPRSGASLARVCLNLERGQWQQSLLAAKSWWPHWSGEERQVFADRLAERSLEAVKGAYPERELLAEDAALAHPQLTEYWYREFDRIALDNQLDDQKSRQRWLRPIVSMSLAETYARLLNEPQVDRCVWERLAKIYHSESLGRPLLSRTISRALAEQSDPMQLPALSEELIAAAARQLGLRSGQDFRNRTLTLAAELGLVDRLAEQLVTAASDGDNYPHQLHLATDDQRTATYCGQPITPAWHRVERGSWIWAASNSWRFDPCQTCAAYAGQVTETTESPDWSVLDTDGYRQALTAVAEEAQPLLTKLASDPSPKAWVAFQSQVARQLDRQANRQLAEQLLARYGSGQQGWQRLIEDPPESVRDQGDWPELDREMAIRILDAYRHSQRNSYHRMKLFGQRQLRSLIAKT